MERNTAVKAVAGLSLVALLIMLIMYLVGKRD